MKINEILLIPPVDDEVSRHDLIRSWQMLRRQTVVKKQKIKGYSFIVFSMGISYFVFIKYKHRLLAMLELVQMKKENNGYYQVAMVLVNPEHQGEGIGKKLYYWTIQNLDIVVVSDFNQTYGGHALWKKLIKHPNINVWAEHGDKKYQVWLNDLNEIESTISVAMKDPNKFTHGVDQNGIASDAELHTMFDDANDEIKALKLHIKDLQLTNTSKQQLNKIYKKELKKINDKYSIEFKDLKSSEYVLLCASKK